MLVFLLWLPIAAAGMADVVGGGIPHGAKCGSAFRWIMAFLFGGLFSRLYEMWKGGPPRATSCCAQPSRPKPRVVLEAVSCCDDDCAICLEPLKDGRFGGAGQLRCGHAFHKECIARWLDRGAVNCPVCRTDCGEHAKVA